MYNMDEITMAFIFVLIVITIATMIGSYLGRHDHLSIDDYMKIADQEELYTYSNIPPKRYIKDNGVIYKYLDGYNYLDGEEVPADSYKNDKGELITLPYHISRGKISFKDSDKL